MAQRTCLCLGVSMNEGTKEKMNVSSPLSPLLPIATGTRYEINSPLDIAIVCIVWHTNTHLRALTLTR